MASTEAKGQSWKYPLPLKQYIHGQWIDAKGTEFLTLLSAVDDTVVTKELSCAIAADVDQAVESAVKGLNAWQGIPEPKRRELLLKYADIIEANAERLSYLETIVVGKPSSLCLAFEIPTAVETIRYFAGFVDKIDGDLTVSEDGYLRGVLQEPLGVCAAIIPFNSPIVTFGMKVAPALATGNSVIVKASEFNPFSALYLGELATQAGIPDGTINILAGAAEAGKALSSHMSIRKISFTGSPIIGRKVQVAAAQSNLKRVTLELGGKSPVLIFDDADPENALQNVLTFLTFNDQGCVLGTRVYVQETIANEFIEKLTKQVEGAATMLGSDPFDKTSFMSPLFHHRQRDTVMKFLNQGKTEATLVTGGGSWGDKGCFVQPTIFYKPKDGAEVVQKEIFGPVIVVDTLSTEDEALTKANNSEYGLAAYVYTQNLDRALRLSKKLEAGSVAVNFANPTHVTIPFGGWKGSGIGSENAKYVLRAYTQPKAVSIKFNAIS